MRFRIAIAIAIATASACGSVPEVTFSDDAGARCEKTAAEICDDGIDNDCNGLADCADPACSAFACTEALPSGWTPIAFSATRDACPSGFGASADLQVVTGTGAGTCACACVPAGGSTACGAGLFTLIASDMSTCSGGATTSTTANATAPSCTALVPPLTIPNGAAFAKATLPPAPAACRATTTSTLPPITPGRSCAVARLGVGCGAGRGCAPKPGGFALCASKPGANACPSAFPVLLTAGTAATEQRGCNACTCRTEACAGTITVYDRSDCSLVGAGRSVTLTPTCDAPAAKNITAIAYKASVADDGCAVAAGFDPASTGTIQWSGRETICCKQ